jgi:hypothetical protein
MRQANQTAGQTHQPLTLAREQRYSPQTGGAAQRTGLALTLETWLQDLSKQDDGEQVRQVSAGKVRQVSSGQKGETAKGKGRTKPTGTPTLGLPPVPNHMCCRSTHGRRESLVAGHSATLNAVVVVIRPMQAAVMGTRAMFRGAILVRCVHVLHGKCMLCVADVKPGLDRVGRSRPNTPPHDPCQGKWAVFGLERRL